MSNQAEQQAEQQANPSVQKLSLVTGDSEANTAGLQPIPGRWTEERANAWDAQRPWVSGCNYVPSYASNPIEMWRKDTFDAKQINKEMAWMNSYGMNGARIFLSYQAFEEDPKNFIENMDTVLAIADIYNVKVMPVLFDGVWNPHPQMGPQPKPKKNVHNAGWVQCPGIEAMEDPAQRDRLMNYVQTIVTTFAHDDRIDIWDVFNEPDNANTSSYNEDPAKKIQLAAGLIEDSVRCIRVIDPDQPITMGIWKGDWKDESGFNIVEKKQIMNSDIITFHCYEKAWGTDHRINDLKRYNRPQRCTEYMARGLGCTFQEVLPIYKEQKVGAYCWGFVKGRSQTDWPWDTWHKKQKEKKQALTPEIQDNKTIILARDKLTDTPQQEKQKKAARQWFHDVLRGNGRSYRREEGQFIKNMMGIGTPPGWTPPPVQLVAPDFNTKFTV